MLQDWKGRRRIFVTTRFTLKALRQRVHCIHSMPPKDCIKERQEVHLREERRQQLAQRARVSAVLPNPLRFQLHHEPVALRQLLLRHT